MSNTIKTAFFLILVSVLLAGTGIFLSYADEPCQVSVEDISGDIYFPRVTESIKNAGSSIDMAMYFVNFNPNDKSSMVSRLVEELVNAHKRGVKVKVILDQNVDFTTWDARTGKWKKEEKNEPVFVYLKKQGIETYFDNLYISTHSKTIVIDREISILGSTNWSDLSLKKNWENSCLIRSKEFAGKLLEDFNRITIDYEASILDEERGPPVRLSQAFITDPALAARILGAHDENVFDLYLLLLKKFDGNPEGSVEIDYKDLYTALGKDKTISFKESRVMFGEALNRLEQRYKLIKIKRRTPQSPVAILLDYPRDKPYVVPQEKYCLIPAEFWQYGWHTILSFPEKYCYLINLKEGGATHGCRWSSFQSYLIREYHINKYAIIRGMKGLRKFNIIEIEYPEYSDNFPYQEKERTKFTLNGLYSPETLKKEKERLAGLYGIKRFKQAEQYAEIVYEGNDIQIIEDSIKKIQEYGIELVDKVFKVVADKSYSNPKRSYRYVVAAIQTEAKEDKQEPPFY